MKELFENIHQHKFIATCLCGFVIAILLLICVTITEIVKILKK